MKSRLTYILFSAGISVVLMAACTKSNHDYDPHPYVSSIPDTNRFAIPYTYNSVNGYRTYYYPNSNTISSQGNYQNGSPSGYWKQYYANGNLMKEGNYSNGQLSGNWIFYYSSGIKKEEGNYQNNIKSGNWTYYYENGKISSQGNYSNGNKEGQWAYYNTDGTHSSTIVY
jgi:antitoxin component YwqK of YwqJK toxin-antitoxin module